MSARAPAHHREPIGIDDATLNQCVDAGHHIEMHLPEIATHNVAEERIAVAGAPTVIRPEDNIAARRKHGDVVDDHTRTVAELVGLGGTTVQLNDQRIARAWLVPERIKEDALDADTVAPLPGNLLLHRQVEVALERVVHAGHTRHGPAVNG